MTQSFPGDPNTPTASATRHGVVATAVTWGLMRVLAHNGIVVPPDALPFVPELIGMVTGGLAAGGGWLWRRFGLSQ